MISGVNGLPDTGQVSDCTLDGTEHEYWLNIIDYA